MNEQSNSQSSNASRRDTGPELRHGAIGLLESTVNSVAAAAPGQASAVAIAALVAGAAYGGAAAILITTLVMLALAVCYQRLNLWEQNAGASYVWVGRAINSYIGFVVGWLMLAGYLLTTVSDILPIGPAVLAFLGLDPSSQWGAVISGIVLGGAVTILAAIGIEIAAKFQTLRAAVEYVILLVFCVIGLYVVFVVQPTGTVQPSWDWLKPTGVSGEGSLAVGMLLAVYLFVGWESSVYLSEETEQAETVPGKAAILSVVILGIFYTLILVSFQGVVPLAELRAHSESALTYIAAQLVPAPWDKFMAFAIVLSVVGTTQAFLIDTARIAFAMGRDSLIPERFGLLSRKYQTPVFGTFLFGGVTIVILCGYIISSSVAESFETVIIAVGAFFAIL
jgi:amino acid transporter